MTSSFSLPDKASVGSVEPGFLPTVIAALYVPVGWRSPTDAADTVAETPSTVSTDCAPAVVLAPGEEQPQALVAGRRGRRLGTGEDVGDEHLDVLAGDRRDPLRHAALSEEAVEQAE
jgi:hypothetical protein